LDFQLQEVHFSQKTAKPFLEAGDSCLCFPCRRDHLYIINLAHEDEFKFTSYMNYNRTHLASTTPVRLVLLAVLILVFLLTSCGDTDSELDKVAKEIEDSNFTLFPNLKIKIPVLSTDSVRIDSVSVYNAYSSIRFDSAMVLTGFVFNYWEDQNAGYSVRETIVDTLNFALHPLYVHNVKLGKLKANSEYQVYAKATYMVKKDTVTIEAAPFVFKTK
jgi:hypothetical protein